MALKGSGVRLPLAPQVNAPSAGPSRSSLDGSAPEFDQVAARERGILDEHLRTALVDVPGRVLLVVGVLRRHAVHRHDRLIAALRRAIGGSPDPHPRPRTGAASRPVALLP